MRQFTIILFGLALACSSPSAPSSTTLAGTNTTVTGTVVERLDGPPYSYLRLTTEKGEVWVAVPMDSVPRGREVTVTHGAALKHFQAPRLGRHFDLVVFGRVNQR